MSFFERNREDLIRRGFANDRLPPGQYFTDRFPILHLGDVPSTDLEAWDLRLFGALQEERTLGWADVQALPHTEVTCDIHCVTKWTKLETRWTGARFSDVMALVEVDPAADTVVAHAEHDYTTNVPLSILVDEGLLAWGYEGRALEPQHGGPLRLLVPRLYFWKSAKWLRGLEWLVGDEPGYWERNGYHNDADPWQEQRYWGD